MSRKEQIDRLERLRGEWYDSSCPGTLMEYLVDNFIGDKERFKIDRTYYTGSIGAHVLGNHGHWDYFIQPIDYKETNEQEKR